MKTCPNCNELVGDDVKTCFNCGWSFENSGVNEKADGENQARKEPSEEADTQNGSGEKFTREELALLNAGTIIKMKKVRNMRVLTTLGLLACLVGSVGLLRLFGASSEVLDEYAQMVMVANSVVAPMGMISAYYKNVAVKSFKDGWAELESGKITEQAFYEHWLMEAWDFSKTNRDEIEKLARGQV